MTLRRLTATWLGVFLLAGLSAEGATPGKKEKSSAQDSAPVLMSRTGGGKTWADLKELEAAAAKGNPQAKTQLGEMLLRGEGIARNETRGVDLLEQAARAGMSGAAFRIGMLLANGESGVARDPARALAYFRAAAAGGEKEAFFNIGAAYASARGVTRDYGEALGWLIVARERGAQSPAERELRQRIQSRSDWIARGEQRAKEIAGEFAGKKVTDFLPPPAPLDFPVSAAKSLAPPKPADDLNPVARPKLDPSLRPSTVPPPVAPPKPVIELPKP
jgi:hypothetical protein